MPLPKRPPSDRSAALVAALRTGPKSTRDLIDQLQISRATLSRLVGTLSDRVLRIGATRSTRYALIEPIPDLGHPLPYFRVTEEGQLLPAGKLSLLGGTPRHSQFHVDPLDEILQGLPPEMADMTPQGFLGRHFAREHAESLNIPSRPQDWSNAHILRFEALRGENLPGNLILGESSAERFLNSAVAPIAGEHDYPAVALQALRGQSAGSSAGGEQPKFSVLTARGHALVKFAGRTAPNQPPTPAQARWRDLLHAEFVALKVIREAGLPAAEARLIDTPELTFLEVLRFDRCGPRGRRPVLTLAAVDLHLFGQMDTWSRSAARLAHLKILSEADRRAIQLIEAFSILIEDTDRHFHNLAFFRVGLPDAELGIPAGTPSLQLAPIFDKLPMMHAPVAERVFTPEERRTQLTKNVPPPPELWDAWAAAEKLAQRYRDEIAETQALSPAFRRALSQR